MSGTLEFTKLWLFDNAIGDAGAAALAALVHPALLEVHLSHNSITTQGGSARSWAQWGAVQGWHRQRRTTGSGGSM